MNNYELAIVINGKLEEEAKIEALEKIKGYIDRFGGKITNIDDWGKKRLAYEINKVKEGFYYFIAFEAEPDVPAELESRLRIMESLLRFMCINLES
jgi:small subunit ribosomal protein S6